MHNNHHEAQVQRTEQKILGHLSHHHSNTEIYKELHHLRANYAKHGQNFNADLHSINLKLQHDSAKYHLPHISIEENGKGFRINQHNAIEHHNHENTTHQYHHGSQLPAAVRGAMTDERHFEKHDHGHGHYQGRFATPAESYGSGHSRHQAAPASPGHGFEHLSHSANSPSKNGFGVALLERLHLPVTHKNLAFLDAWQRAEGGSSDNPFNTTQGAPGARNFNGVGVKRYPSMEIGLDATVKTLTNGYYGRILAALRREDTHTAANALRVSSWGTHNMPNMV